MTFCMFAGLAMPFQRWVPFSSSLLALGITEMGFALLTRDGTWAMMALLPIRGAETAIMRLTL